MAEEAKENDSKQEGGSGISRRMFLKGVAAGAVAAGVLAAVPSVLAGTPEGPDGGGAELSQGDTSGPIVVYVRDPSTGEVSILSGTKEFVRRDPGLVSRLKSAGIR